MFESKDELVGHSRRSHSDLERRRHFNSVRFKQRKDRLEIPPIDPDEEETSEKNLPGPYKKKITRTRVPLTPTSEIEIKNTEEGPIIEVNDYSGTEEDVQKRIEDQLERISSLSTAQRTVVEQKYIDKKTSDKLDKAS